MLKGPNLLVALIVAATVLFAVGTTIERNQGDSHAATEKAQGETHAGETAGGESGKQAEQNGETSHADEAGSTQAPSESHSYSSEKILGIEPESTGLVIVAVIVSLLLAAAAWRWPDHRLALVVIALAMLAFAALDIREVVHQLNESRTGLGLLAALVAALHLGASALSGNTARSADA
jgi:hypothetical protein